MPFSEHEIKLFDQIIRDLGLAIKNSVLYSTDHPVCALAINNLKSSLDKWFLGKDGFNLGISQDELFLDGENVKEKTERYTEIAEYLHQRGIVSLVFRTGLDEKGLEEFFGFIKQGGKEIRKKGGIRKNLKAIPHLEIKEVDYSALLTSAKGGGKTDEEKIWKFLFDVTQETKGGDIPESKVEFMVNFFENTGNAAKVLNRVYKEAVKNLQDEETAEEIRHTVAEICKYFEKRSKPEAKNLKVKLMHVVSQLHPDLINTLFEQTVVDGETFDLVEDITRDFSDSYIAGFIETLISGEDTFNENLLKVFDKLAPDAHKADNVVGMVADKLFQKRILNPDTLSKLQMSIKEIFRGHPESSFMTELYKITVDAVVNKKVDTLVYVARLSPIINKFVQSMEEGKLKKEEIWLLLNILWLENDFSEFDRFGRKIVDVLPELLDGREIDRIKDILEFFTDKMRPEQKEDEKISKETQEVMEQITTREMKDSVISFIPDATHTELDDITDILKRSGAGSAKQLIDAFIQEKNPALRNKFRTVLSRMKKEVSEEVIDRLEYSEPYVIRDLFGILKEYAPEKAHLVALKLIVHKNPQVRWEGLEGFEPGDGEELEAVFRMFKRERDREVQKKAAAVLLKTRDPVIIERVFRYAERSFFRPGLLLRLVELCGYIRSQESFPHLKRIFVKRPLISTKRRDEIRAAAVTSLGRLHTTQAMDLIKHGLRDKRERVKKMCEIILLLDERGEIEQESKEGGGDAGRR